MRRALVLAAALMVPAGAGAQTMLDQQQRLIQIHSLLLDLVPVDAPGSYRPGELSLGLELVAIPPIDGATGSRRQITASDHTPVFPRPRLAIGLPAPDGFRAFAGVSYIPPLSIEDVSSHFVAAEAGVAWAPGALRVGLRGHLLYADSRSPVTDPLTRDSLFTLEYGGDLSAAWVFAFGPGSLAPYGGIGLSRLSSDFRVTSDGVVLSSRYTAPALHAGVRLFAWSHWEGTAEVEFFPGRLVHPALRIGYVLDLGSR